MYILDDFGGTYKIFQYTLSTAWDISTASYSGKSKDITSTSNLSYGFTISADGTKLYTNSNNAYTIYQWTLSTPWDISTASYASLSFYHNRSNTEGVTFSPDGTTFYIARGPSNFVYPCPLSTAWDISTASLGSYKKLFNYELPYYSSLRDVVFSSDGKNLYAVGANLGYIYHYQLGTAWDVLTATYIKSSEAEGGTADHEGIFLSSDGTRAFVVGDNSTDILQFDLGGQAKGETSWTYANKE